MGFHLRKTKKIGLFNFNLSNSGIGTSFGIKGLRVGVDGKGRAYVGGGKGILRYREYFNSTSEIPTNENLYDSVVEYIPYMMKENSLTILGKLLFWISLVLFMPFIIGGFAKEPAIGFFFSSLCLCFAYSVYFCRQARARKVCKKALKFLKQNDIKTAIMLFEKAKQIYKNIDFNTKINDIVSLCKSKIQ